MFKKISLFLLLLFSFNIPAKSVENLSTFIEQWRQENQIPAVAVAIKMAGKNPSYYSKGTTTLNGKTKITAHNLFGIGSITKTFIAATLLQLQETHKLSLNDSLGKYFPEYPRWSKISIRQLLNMTSGIPNFTRTEAFKKLIEHEPSAYHPASFFVDLAYGQKDEFMPGKGWYYSNTNYYLLGMIIEKITNQSLPLEFQQRFFTPLHLHNTYYSINSYPISIYKRQVHAYLDNKDVTKENPAYYGPAGSMLMDIQDLLTWTEALFTPGKILSKHSLNELLQTQAVPLSPPKPNNARYGLGIYSVEIPGYGLVWWYTGVINGYSSMFMWIPNKQTIIVAQIDRWKDNNFGLLMPGQNFINIILETI